MRKAGPSPASAPEARGVRCLDPEALSVAPDGSLYVSDEYRPALLHFDREGALLRDIPLLEWYRPIDSEGRTNYLTRVFRHVEIWSRSTT